jgi:hypothetical protein
VDLKRPSSLVIPLPTVSLNVTSKRGGGGDHSTASGFFFSFFFGCARLEWVVEGCLVMDDTGRRWSCWWSEKWKMKLMLVVEAVTGGAVLAAAGTEKKRRS